MKKYNQELTKEELIWKLIIKHKSIITKNRIMKNFKSSSMKIYYF